MNTKHTPTPWEYYTTMDLKPHIELGGDGTANIVGANSHNNAHFIVRACNSHAALLEALENLNSMARAFTVYRDDIGQVLEKQVLAAIAKAKAEQS